MVFVFFRVSGILSTMLLASGGAGVADVTPIASDTGVRGGEVALLARPSLTTENALRKQFLVESLEGVKSAQILLFAALRDGMWTNDFSFAAWEWLIFDLNGYQWVRRVEDLPLYRRSGFDVNWADVDWAPIEVPEVAYLNEGVNQLTIWNNNLPEKPQDKFLVVAYDDQGTSRNSFSLVNQEWTPIDLNGDREGAPQGEWMIRLQLNRRRGAAGRVAQILSRANLEQAQAAGVDYLWGVTDALHHIFPDRPYEGPVRNEWTLEAAQGEYESCQLAVIPVKRDLRGLTVSVGTFRGKDGAALPPEAVTVRLVKPVRVNGRLWPDRLPPAVPCDVQRGTVQPFWITVQAPRDAQPGRYRAQGKISTISPEGSPVEPATFVLHLRVRRFTVPPLSDHAMVVGCGIPQEAENLSYRYHTVHGDCVRGWPSPRAVLTEDGQLTLDFNAFDQQMEEALATGVKTFSLGRSLVGAGTLSPWCFDDEVEVQGQTEKRRIWLCPVEKYARDDSKAYFESYLRQVYDHLEAKGWTNYFWLYGADEAHGEEWSEVCQEYFSLVKRIAPKLRIQVTIGPTDRFGPTVDIFCTMMNHLRPESAKAAQERQAELWCYSCGDLNNPALTIPHAPLTVRLWHWLQEKWDVHRSLLWAISAGSDNYEQPGADGRGDGQLLWCEKTDGEVVWYPSVRAEMLRDGIEDREYFARLREAVAKAEQRGRKGAALERARELLTVPDRLVETQFNMTRDPQAVLAFRKALAEAIERLQ